MHHVCYNLVVTLLLLSRIKSKSRQKATEVDSVVSDEFLKSFIIERDQVINVTI